MGILLANHTHNASLCFVFLVKQEVTEIVPNTKLLNRLMSLINVKK